MGKLQLLLEEIVRDSHLALLDGCDLLPKAAVISPNDRMVLEFFIAVSYSIYSDRHFFPSLLGEMPCSKTVLSLWKLGGFAGFVSL